MQYDEFVGKVQSRARLASSGDAVSAIRATLQTLSERVVGGAAGNLAAQLPREVGVYLEDGDDSRRAESFDLDEFFRRVSEREQEDLPAAVFHARAVVETLEEAVSPGQFDNLKAALPDEFRPLLESGTEGRMR